MHTPEDISMMEKGRVCDILEHMLKRFPLTVPPNLVQSSCYQLILVEFPCIHFTITQETKNIKNLTSFCRIILVASEVNALFTPLETAENKVMEFYNGRMANYKSSSRFSSVFWKCRSMELASNLISHPLILSSLQTFLILLRDLWCIFVLGSLFSSVIYMWVVHCLI